MRFEIASIIAVSLLLSTTNAYGQACADGRQVTITGTLAKKQEGDSERTLDVASSTPCVIDMLLVNGTVPTACVGGASFKASGKILDMVGTFLDAKSITCR